MLSAILIKIRLKLNRLRRKRSCFFRHSRTSNFEMNSPIWSKFELVRDFMPVLVACKFDQDPTKSDAPILQTAVSHFKFCGIFFQHSVTINSEVNSPVCPDRTHPRFFMPVPVICKFHEDRIKSKQAMHRTRSNMVLFGTQGQITPK